jgi:hypothetical protein
MPASCACGSSSNDSPGITAAPTCPHAQKANTGDRALGAVPKPARQSGRPHFCIPQNAPRLCPSSCAGHASTCPDRYGGGLTLREIKERRRKTVPLPPELVAILRAHQSVQELERAKAEDLWEDHGVVFAQENGRPIDPKADWQEWSDILKAAGIPHHGVHAMRHSAATIALDEGVALAVVQELLGHSDIA